MEDWKAKQAARDSAAKALQAAHPHLIPKGDCRDGLIAAAKNARIELARAFPGVKFSVKTRRFSGGDAMDVSWTDGPNSTQVDAIIDRYAAGSFNGMDDSYTYTHDIWTRAFGDAKYVSGSRSLSAKTIASAIRTVLAKWASDLKPVSELMTVERYMNGDLARVVTPGALNGYGTQSLSDLISQTAYRRTWCVDQTPKAQAMDDAEQETAA